MKSNYERLCALLLTLMFISLTACNGSNGNEPNAPNKDKDDTIGQLHRLVGYWYADVNLMDPTETNSRTVFHFKEEGVIEISLYPKMMKDDGSQAYTTPMQISGKWDEKDNLLRMKINMGPQPVILMGKISKIDSKVLVMKIYPEGMPDTDTADLPLVTYRHWSNAEAQAFEESVVGKAQPLQSFFTGYWYHEEQGLTGEGKSDPNAKTATILELKEDGNCSIHNFDKYKSPDDKDFSKVDWSNGGSIPGTWHSDNDKQFAVTLNINGDMIKMVNDIKISTNMKEITITKSTFYDKEGKKTDEDTIPLTLKRMSEDEYKKFMASVKG